MWWFGQAALLQVGEHRGEHRGWDGQVEGVVATGASLSVQGRDLVSEAAVGLGIGGVAGYEPDALGQAFPGGEVETRAGMLSDRLTDGLREILILPIASGEADKREARR